MYILLENNKTIREKGFTDQFQKHNKVMTIEIKFKFKF